MFQKKTKKQQKPKKLRVYTVNSRKPAVIAMWLLFVCGFAFAVYKNFTAIDTHTVHEKEIVEWRVEDTSGVEAFVRNFAKTYYSWSNNKDSVAQRTDALTGYLTEDLQRLTADTVRSDVAVSSSVQDVQIWSVEQNGENDTVELMTRGNFVQRGNSYYIVYAETEATGYAGCTTTVRVSQDARLVSMTRFGKTSSQLIIEKGIRHLCHYETGYGSISLGVAADVIEHNLLPDGGELQFSYTLDSGAETLISRNSVLITVEPLKKQETEVE